MNILFKMACQRGSMYKTSASKSCKFRHNWGIPSVRKMPAPIKIKLALPHPPSRKPQPPPPPPLNEEFYGHGGFPAEIAEKMPATIKLAQPYPAPELRAEIFLIPARKKSTNPSFRVRIFSGGVWVFHMKGWGPKSSVCPSKPGNQTLGRDIPGFCLDILAVPERFEKKVSVQFWAPTLG